jgi:hypothetical protein
MKLKKKETKVEKEKMVSIELTENFVRYSACLAEKYKIWSEFETACLKWVKANPEPKKTRPMTELERLRWALKNKDCVIYWQTEIGKLRNYWSRKSVLDLTSLDALLAADSYKDRFGKMCKFEVEVPE